MRAMQTQARLKQFWIAGNDLGSKLERLIGEGPCRLKNELISFRKRPRRVGDDDGLLAIQRRGQ